MRSEGGRQFRKAFVASPGSRLLIADYNQIELRCIAHLAADPGLVAAFTDGQDIHNATAARVFGVEPGKVTLDMRSKAKMVSYGLAYGMEAYGLGQRLNIATEDAAVILNAYFAAFPNVKAYMDGTVKEARMRGYTETLFGRRRPIPELSNSNFRIRQAGERQAMNAGIQGLAADIFKVALVRLDAALEAGGYESRITLQVHDEVIVDVPAGEEDGGRRVDRHHDARRGPPRRSARGQHLVGRHLGRRQDAEHWTTRRRTLGDGPSDAPRVALLPSPSMRARASIVSFVALTVVLGACSSSSDDSSSTEAPAATAAVETSAADTTTATTAAPTTEAPTTAAPTTAAAAPLRIMVTNDDGVAGEGISVLVDALAKVPNVEVTVIAPKDDKSGSGDTVTPGPLTATDATLVSGHPAKAVDGFPADTVIYAFEQGGLAQKPNLVVSGINKGQNIGPAIPLSGTVGAALTAAKAGVPAVAVSQQTLKDPAPVPPDYPTGAQLVVDWIAQNRAAIEGGTLTPDVYNLNVPTCQGGKVRGVAEVKPATDLTGRDYLAPSDCASPVTITALPTDDLDALIRGYASLSQLDPASIVGVG